MTTAVEFLRNVCADETLKVQGRAVVIGGGNVAIDVARSSLRCGAQQVEMYCLEQRKTMPASAEEVAEALEEGVSLNCGWGPKEILTSDGKVVRCV